VLKKETMTMNSLSIKNAARETVEENMPIDTAIRHVPKLPGVTDEEHQLGLKLQTEIPGTVARVLVVGKDLATAHESLCRPGRASSFADFCDHYLPSIDRKTLDRWRLAYVNFRSLLTDSEDEYGHACPYSENIRLTALYRLSATDVTDADRRTAVEAAKNGKVVDVKLASAIVGKKGGTPPAKKYRKKISLPAGCITLSLNHQDWVQALSEALGELDQD
jgi:hypothetical protein